MHYSNLLNFIYSYITSKCATSNTES